MKSRSSVCPLRPHPKTDIIAIDVVSGLRKWTRKSVRSYTLHRREQLLSTRQDYLLVIHTLPRCYHHVPTHIQDSVTTHTAAWHLDYKPSLDCAFTSLCRRRTDTAAEMDGQKKCAARSRQDTLKTNAAEEKYASTPAAPAAA